MNAPTFIDGLRERGAALEIESGRLRVTPATALTDADRMAWRDHKQEIIALLENASRATSSTRTDLEEFADVRRFYAATKRAKREINPVLRRELNADELREYSFVAACLACEIDPRGVPMRWSLISRP